MAEKTPAPDIPDELFEKMGMVREAITHNKKSEGNAPILSLLQSEFDGEPVWVLTYSNVNNEGDPVMTYPIAIMVTNDMVDSGRLKDPTLRGQS